MAAVRARISSAENWCISQSEVIDIPFKWSIRNFDFYTGTTGYLLKSDKFPSEPARGTKWRLQLYPSGITLENKGYLSLYLELVPDSSEIKPTVKFRCSILDKENRETNNQKLLEPCTYNKKPVSWTWGWPKFVATDLLTTNAKELLPNHTLVLYFEIRLLIKLPASSGTASTTKIPENSLAVDFSGLFEKELFSDVTLVANGENFKVHKNILAARSTVFEAMFTSEMKEKNQDVIEVKDMDENVMYHMLRFMYTGEPPSDASLKLTSDLLVASDKYNLERLKIICESSLCPQITFNNVSDLLLLAYLHCANQLKATTMDFVKENILAVMKSEKWSSLMQYHPQLVNEVIAYHLQCSLKRDK